MHILSHLDRCSPNARKIHYRPERNQKVDHAQSPYHVARQPLVGLPKAYVGQNTTCEDVHDILCYIAV